MQGSDNSTRSLGHIGYEAYGNHPGKHGAWMTFDGRPMPMWPELGGSDAGQLTQARWEVAVAAAVAEYQKRKPAARGALNVAEVTMTMDTSQAQKQLEALAATAERVGEALGEISTSAAEGQIDPFLLGIQEIASATRDVAEATKAMSLASAGLNHPVWGLIDDVAKALHARVRALAEPAESAA